MTDAELVAGLKANDEAAYREVVARYGDPLYGYIYSITGNHHVSEDIVGQTYLRMVEKIDTYTFYGAPFKAWLYRIAHNLAMNALKQARRTTAADPAELATLVADDDPAATIEMQMQSEALRAALAELTEEQQQVVLLRYVAGHSSREVAEALDKTENAVKQMLFRALRSLGRLIEAQENP